jgi:hypothetical protein
MSSEQMARYAFGDPGFFDFLAPLAKPFKAVAPILSTAASFIPIAGPLISKAIDFGAGLITEDAADLSGADRSGDDDTEVDL